MALNQLLLDVLACPNDKQPLYYSEADSWLYNPRLRLRYAIEGDIPILLPESGDKLDDEEHAQMMTVIAEQSLTSTGNVPPAAGDLS